MHNPERALSALHALDPGVPREQWVRIAMAAKSAGLTFEDFDAWSSQAGNYSGEADTRSVWKSIDEQGGVKAGSLYALAKAAGWREDRAAGNVRPLRPAAPVRAARVVPPTALQAASAAWSAGTPVTPDHPYVARKRLLIDGLRVYRGPLAIKGHAVDGWLMMPGFVGAELRTLQFIGPSMKLHFPGLAVEGFYTIGGAVSGDVYLCEGIGAAHSCHQATRRTAIASFGAGNTARAAEWIVAQGARPVIVSDKGKEMQAAEIARSLDCAWVEMPPESPANYDINDMHCAADLGVVAHFLASSERRHGRKYALLSAHDLIALPPIRWRVKGLLPEAGVGVIGGQSTAGKTFVALDLALRVARGDTFFGHRSYRCPVAFLALEGVGGFAGRLRAWEHTHGKLPKDVHFLVRQSFDVRDAQDRAELVRTLGDNGFRDGIVIVDTLAQAAVGMEENSSEGMGQAIAGLQELQGAVGGLVLAIHHLGKDASKGLRGHSSLFAACDVVMEVTRDGDARSWKIAKSKDGRDSEGFAFDLHDVEIGTDFDGEPVTSCVVMESNRPLVVAQPIRGDRQIMADQVIGRLLSESTVFGKGDAPPTRPCIALDAAVEAISERLTCPSFKRANEARKIIESLARRNRIMVQNDWIWSN